MSAKPVYINISVEVNASQKKVWDALHDQRAHDPDIPVIKTLKQNGNEFLMEEHFIPVPIIGETWVVLDQHEQPNERIDFALVRSNRFKQMDGAWVVADHGSSSTLTLYTMVDMGMPIPLFLEKWITEFKLRQGLLRVKNKAEQ